MDCLKFSPGDGRLEVFHTFEHAIHQICNQPGLRTLSAIESITQQTSTVCALLMIAQKKDFYFNMIKIKTHNLQ